MDGKMIRIAELEIDPARLAAYRPLLTEEIETSMKNEPGVLMLHAVAERSRPEHIRILEIYANQDAYEAHLRTPHFLKYKTETSGLVRSLTLVDVDPIILAAK